MKFKKIPGVLGKVYTPDNIKDKKNNCKDCFYCQWCCDSRCNECLKKKEKPHK